jgi:hypothetical protein
MKKTDKNKATTFRFLVLVLLIIASGGRYVPRGTTDRGWARKDAAF